jgi:hypothetical protein
MLAYDEDERIRRLDRLPAKLRVAFALACAERLMGGFRTYSGGRSSRDEEVLAQIMNQLWQDTQGNGRLSSAELAQMLDTCMALMPGEGDSAPHLGDAIAEDCVAAIAYAIRCRQNGQSQQAAWAACRAYEALDQYVIRKDSLNVYSPGGESQVLADPRVQAELRRQQTDIDELSSMSTEDLTRLKALQERSRFDSGTSFV